MPSEQRWWLSRDKNGAVAVCWIGPKPPELNECGIFVLASGKTALLFYAYPNHLSGYIPAAGECVEIEPLVIRRKASNASVERAEHERQQANEIAALREIVADIEQVRNAEGNCITFVRDDPEAQAVPKQCAVDVIADFTGFEEQRFYGATWPDALASAAASSRAFNSSEKRSESE